MFDIIPAIDLLDGKVVRLSQGDYNRVEFYDITPTDLAKSYQDAGIRKIHIVDLDGAKAGKCVNLETVEAIRKAVPCKLELGGGLRSLEAVKDVINLGVDYPIIGSLLVKNLPLALSIIDAFPNQIIGGLDLKDGQIAVDGWLETSPLSVTELLSTLKDHPVAYLICTNVANDGMMQGPDTEGLLDLSQLTNIPLIASGGVSSTADVEQLQRCVSEGISGCIIGKAIMNGAISMDELKGLVS